MTQDIKVLGSKGEVLGVPTTRAQAWVEIAKVRHQQFVEAFNQMSDNWTTTTAGGTLAQDDSREDRHYSVCIAISLRE